MRQAGSDVEEERQAPTDDDSENESSKWVRTLGSLELIGRNSHLRTVIRRGRQLAVVGI